MTRLSTFVSSPNAAQIKAIVIGSWMGGGIETTSGPIVKALADARSKLPNLRAIFLGDITFEECEISWLHQSDVSPLLQAYPLLEEFIVHGGQALAFTPIKHIALQRLVVETGGLATKTVQEILACDFPNLVDLELWLGSDHYGYDGDVDDLKPIFEAANYPKLRSLGLRNSVITDAIAQSIASAPILRQLDVLDLSHGYAHR